MVAPGLWRAARPGITWGGDHQLGTAEELADLETFSGDVDSRWTSTADGSPGEWGIGTINTPELVALGGGGEVGTLSVGSGASLLERHIRVVSGLDPAGQYVAGALMDKNGFGTGSSEFTFRVTDANGVHIREKLVAGGWEEILHGNLTPTVDGEITLELRGEYISGANVSTGWYVDNVRVAKVVPVFPSMLRFGYPADAVIAGPVLRADSERLTRRSGIEDVARGTVLRRLRCDCRWIPAVDGTTREGHLVTGWEGIGSWERFLEHAWGGASFLFHPDQEDPDTAWTSWLEEPAPFGRAEPFFELEPDGTRRLSLSLLSLVPYAGW